MEKKSRLPYSQIYDYRMIKAVRQMKNLTLSQFAEIIGIDPATLSKLENNNGIHFSMHYESKFKEALRKLHVTNLEIASLRQLILIREGNRK